MSMIYLPTADQMDETVDSLSKIAKALGSKVDVSSWENIRKAVKLGLAPEVLPIGTQLIVNHSKYGDIVFDVVAHDYLKSAEDENAHTMTLMAHNCLEVVQYDSREAFYYAAHGLSAGTYNFTLNTNYSGWLAGTYHFTLSEDLPIGGQLCISDKSVITDAKVRSYSSANSTTMIEECTITQGVKGVNIGTFGAELNHGTRVIAGSNNYKESALRQFLNSSAEAGSVWTPQTKFDRPPSWVSNTEGFVRGFEEDFTRVIGKVSIPCAANRVYEADDSTTTIKERYTVLDRFYPLSDTEIFGITNDTVSDGSVILSYYEGAEMADRVKYKEGASVTWWTRTASPWDGDTVACVNYIGKRVLTNAYKSMSIAVACTIV